MPETPVLPPMDRIGTNGEFTSKIELIVVEQAHQRLFVDPSTGETIAKFTPQAPAPQQPAILTENVCGFSVQRVGIKHSERDLSALRGVVEHMASYLQRGLQIVDLYGWSGEIALAMCRAGSQDTVTIVEDFIGTDRNLAPVAGLWDILSNNVGVLMGSRINLVDSDPSDLCGELRPAEEEFDIIFVDSAATPDRLRDMLASWVPFLSPTGLICGISTTEEQDKVIHEFFGDGVEMVTQDLWCMTYTAYELNVKESVEQETVGV